MEYLHSNRAVIKTVSSLILYKRHMLFSTNIKEKYWKNSEDKIWTNICKYSVPIIWENRVGLFLYNPTSLHEPKGGPVYAPQLFPQMTSSFWSPVTRRHFLETTRNIHIVLLTKEVSFCICVHQIISICSTPELHLPVLPLPIISPPMEWRQWEQLVHVLFLLNRESSLLF